MRLNVLKYLKTQLAEQERLDSTEILSCLLCVQAFREVSHSVKTRQYNIEKMLGALEIKLQRMLNKARKEEGR